VLKADKFFPKTYVAMADVCLKTNNYFDGLKLITFYIFLCPDDPDAFNTKGRLHYRLNQYALSIDNYSEAINLRGNDWEFFNNRGLAFQEMHKYEEALEDYAEALERPCNKQRIYTNRGEVVLL
jgi:tetratricopeptide (TPR) repeat protein